VATLTLTKLFMNLLATGEAVSAQSDDRSAAYSVAGEVRTYAGGRRRSITQAGERGTFEFTMRLVPTATVTTLRLWIGREVEVRDNLGRQFFGTFFEVPTVEYKDNPGFWDVPIKLAVVSSVEGV
jgi:hypothetical protein